MVSSLRYTQADDHAPLYHACLRWPCNCLRLQADNYLFSKQHRRRLTEHMHVVKLARYIYRERKDHWTQRWYKPTFDLFTQVLTTSTYQDLVVTGTIYTMRAHITSRPLFDTRAWGNTDTVAVSHAQGCFCQLAFPLGRMLEAVICSDIFLPEWDDRSLPARKTTSCSRPLSPQCRQPVAI